MFTKILKRFKGEGGGAADDKRQKGTNPAPHQQSAKNHKVCFLHVPKAGGTSIGAFFEKFYHAGSVATLLSPHDLMRVPDAEMAGVEFVRSHAIRTAYECFHRDFRTVSLMRHPVQRTISHYQHLRSVAETNPEFARFAGLSLRAFLSREDGRAEVTNFQSSLYGIEGIVATPFLVEPHGCRRFGLIDQLQDKRLLDDALAFLNKVDHVGTLENWSLCLQTICMAMGWPLPSQKQLLQLNKGDGKFGDETKANISEIERLTELDIELYDFVSSAEKKKKLETDSYIDEYIAKYKSDKYKTKTNYYWNFEKPFFAEGIYQRESVVVKNGFGRADIGEAFGGRLMFSYWADEELAFDVWLEPDRNYRLRVLGDFLPGFKTDVVTLRINGTAIDQASWRYVRGRELWIDAHVPVSLLEASGFARIQIDCPGQSQRYASDHRSLALHLQWIEIAPEKA